jgi:predicted RNase H-like nuclease
MQAVESKIVFGFDSAWTDRPNAPGAICAIGFSDQGIVDFHPPELVSFSDALKFIQSRRRNYRVSLVALDQPTKVPNPTGSRPVDKVAGALVSFVGGGVQPANRSKADMFGDDAPIWSFLAQLGATEDPFAARAAEYGNYVMEVFPALALPSLNNCFAQRMGAPKYNPQNRRKYRQEDWRSVARLVADNADRLGISALGDWARKMHDLYAPRKSDQDKIDSAICAIVGMTWLVGPAAGSAMLGDLNTGYMITPISDATRFRLEQAANRRNTPFCLPVE